MRSIFLGSIFYILSLLSPATVALSNLPPNANMTPRDVESTLEPQRFGLESSLPGGFSGPGRFAVRQTCPGGTGTCSNDPSTCCPLGGRCCGSGKCCGSGNWCYAGGCCPNNRNGCDKKGCCPKDWNCCKGGDCCQPEYYCVRTSSGKIGCCPNGKTCTSGFNGQKSSTDASVPPSLADPN